MTTSLNVSISKNKENDNMSVQHPFALNEKKKINKELTKNIDNFVIC